MKRLSQTMSEVAFELGFADKVSLPNKERAIPGRCIHEEMIQKSKFQKVQEPSSEPTMGKSCEGEASQYLSSVTTSLCYCCLSK